MRDAVHVIRLRTPRTSLGVASPFWTRHGFSTDLTVERTDDRYDYGEVRIYAIGLVNGIEITVIYTDRDPDERHIISMEIGAS